MNLAAPAPPRAQTLERVLRDFESVAAQLPEEIVPRAVRRRAAERLRKLGWPQGRDEQWRYTNLRAFDRLPSYAPSTALESSNAPRSSATVEPGVETALPPGLPGFERLVFIDGVGPRSRSLAQPAGTLAFPSWPVETAWTDEQRLGLLGDMFAQDAAVLRIAGEASLELVFLTSGRAAGAAVYPRLQVELAPASRLTLIERHLGAPEALTLCCASSMVELGRGAQLMHYRLQECGAQVLFAETLTARLHSEASYQVRQLAVGALSARSSTNVRLEGRGAAFGWQGIAVGHADQVHDTTLKVEHAAAATRTEEVFRGIAEERARLALSAHIHISPLAPGAEARQSLRGLIEGAGAEIDLRPRLQIDTDEVSAQHGATTGQLDEQLLFYLLARGIDRKTARALLKWAFLGDVLRAFELPSLRAQAERSAAGQLRDVLAVGAASA